MINLKRDTLRWVQLQAASKGRLSALEVAMWCGHDPDRLVRACVLLEALGVPTGLPRPLPEPILRYMARGRKP